MMKFRVRNRDLSGNVKWVWNFVILEFTTEGFQFYSGLEGIWSIQQKLNCRVERINSTIESSCSLSSPVVWLALLIQFAIYMSATAVPRAQRQSHHTSKCNSHDSPPPHASYLVHTGTPLNLPIYELCHRRSGHDAVATHLPRIRCTGERNGSTQ